MTEFLHRDRECENAHLILLYKSVIPEMYNFKLISNCLNFSGFISIKEKSLKPFARINAEQNLPFLACLNEKCFFYHDEKLMKSLSFS